MKITDFVKLVEIVANKPHFQLVKLNVSDAIAIVREVRQLKECYGLLKKHHNNDHHNGNPGASWYKDMPGFGDQEIEIMHGHDPYEAYEEARKLFAEGHYLEDIIEFYKQAKLGE